MRVLRVLVLEMLLLQRYVAAVRFALSREGGRVNKKVSSRMIKFLL